MELTLDEILDRYLVFNCFKDSTIPLEVIYSDYLNKYAVVTEDGILFEDGVSYAAKELLCMLGEINFNRNKIKFIHACRHCFEDSKIIF